MELAMIGLGKMGAFMAERLLNHGHSVIGYDMNPEATQKLVEKGAGGADSLEGVVEKLSRPRILWMMVPSGKAVDETIQALLPLVNEGDVIVDGGNSYYKDTLRRGAMLRQKKVNYVDVGTSGGVWGLKEGYSMMVGGDEEVVKRMTPIFEALAPAPDKGWGYVGAGGSGHFVKMVHNGIEYGLMQAYAEGMAILQHKEDFDLDLHKVAEIWRFGSVIRSWLLDLISEGLEENPTLEGIAPYVVDSGEGRWTVDEAIELSVSAPAITVSLMERFRSRDPESFADKLLAMTRNKFGGHAIKKEG
ncbi:MAG: decarboxylating 6-phosphogluconate dehydrogenase [Acidobacteriota bacterium]|jgi:6-phosphogluconate dehydrogenase